MTDNEEMKLPVLARDELRRQLRKHPDIRKHVPIKLINKLGKAEDAARRLAAAQAKGSA